MKAKAGSGPRPIGRIRRITISNYRSLGEDVTVDLDGMTVLVGPNGSGKSNLMDVLRFVAECARDGLGAALAGRQGIERLCRIGTKEVALRMEVAGEDAEGSWEFALAPSSGGRVTVIRESAGWRLTKQPPAEVAEKLQAFLRGVADSATALGAPKNRRPNSRADRFLESFREWSFRFEVRKGRLSKESLPVEVHGYYDELVLPTLFRLPSGAIFAPLIQAFLFNTVYAIAPEVLRRPQPVDPFWPMRDRGQNWATALRNLPTARKPDLLATLGRVTGDIDDCRIAEAGGFLIPEFRHGAERWLGAAQESDGTLRAAAIVTALLQHPAPPLIGIEEPELSLHPGAIPVLVDHVREAAEVRSQILVTTQSPEVIDLVGLEQVRLVERRDGVTSVSRVDPSQREAVRKRLVTAGEAWRTEGLRPATRDDG